MTIPIFAKTVLEANSTATIAEIPVNVLFATATLNICNTDTGGPESEIPARVQIGFGPGPTMQLVDTLDHASLVAPNGGLLIRSCSVAKPGDKIFVKADRPGVVVNFTALCQELVAG